MITLATEAPRAPKVPKVGARTPWGKADHVEWIGPGVWRVATPGHGGFKLDRKTNALVHEAWRRVGGWYEEDCEWAIVRFTLRYEGWGASVEDAVSLLKNYWPDQYTEVTGEPVLESESRVLRERAFAVTNKGRFVTRSASGSWHPTVPEGYVGVHARTGDGREGRFLVSSERYDTASPFGYVVDESIDQPWTGSY